MMKKIKESPPPKIISFKKIIKKPASNPQYALVHLLAGAEGFEPPNGGTRIRCLTTWRHPKIPRNFKITKRKCKYFTT